MRIVVAIPRKHLRYLDEEMSLVKAVYNDIVDVISVNRANPRTYISAEKLSRLRSLDFDKLIVMDSLKPSQLVNLMRELKREVEDRTLLILEIFALHAGSREAQLQIELAKLRHQLPLAKEAIRYAKLGELHGFLGAGEYGYERYYLMLKRREARTRRELKKLAAIREARRRARAEAGFKHVAIAGYTCAGKTTLFNAITGLALKVGPEPFTTLSPKSYRVMYGGLQFIVTDTVGFIRDLPPQIVEAFFATLEEIASADVVINVVDASKNIGEVLNEVDTAFDIFAKIGVSDRKVIISLNKTDLVGDVDPIIEAVSSRVGSRCPVIPISAAKGANIDKLLNEVINRLGGGCA